MATSRNRFTAARLAKLNPDEAYQELLAASKKQHKALFEELKKPEFRQLGADLEARVLVDNLNRNVRAEEAELARRAPQIERERAARLAARRKTQQ